MYGLHGLAIRFQSLKVMRHYETAMSDSIYWK
jgi:hypothetical protein